MSEIRKPEVRFEETLYTRPNMDTPPPQEKEIYMRNNAKIRVQESRKEAKSEKKRIEERAKGSVSPRARAFGE